MPGRLAVFYIAKASDLGLGPAPTKAQVQAWVTARFPKGIPAVPPAGTAYVLLSGDGSCDIPWPSGKHTDALTTWVGATPAAPALKP